MELSVAYSFNPGLIDRLSKFKEVKEIYGKLAKDIIGGGRTSYTLRNITKTTIYKTVKEAHKHNISFNYLLNGATLNGLEQTIKGQKQIRRLLNFLTDANVDSVTVASPLLLRIIKRQYPHLKVRISVFAVVNSPEKAIKWEQMGADTICISAIACNRNFDLLKKIRKSVNCGLQLIVNASCLSDCTYELTHMNLLTNSSKIGDINNGFCFDYCLLHCFQKRFEDPVNYIKSIWIRPEDLSIYEEIGYDNFKIVERSCPSDLIIKRVEAYVNRSFNGNLLELVAPVAHIKKEQRASLKQRARIVRAMLQPYKLKIKSLLGVKKYMENVIFHEFSKENAPVYIDNKSLDNFLQEILKINCHTKLCSECKYCDKIAEKLVKYNEDYRNECISLGNKLNDGIDTSSHWL
jgi:collagenase-like PrtC family protease